MLPVLEVGIRGRGGGLELLDDELEWRGEGLWLGLRGDDVGGIIDELLIWGLDLYLLVEVGVEHWWMVRWGNLGLKFIIKVLLL